MFILSHEGDKVGTTMLESGDPTLFAVSGAFNNIGGAKAIAGWMKSIGGSEDDGVVFIGLDENFCLEDSEDNQLKFEEATLIAIPADDEVFLDVKGMSADDYEKYFTKHIQAADS
ncbi:MAG: hypothetical protein MI867_24685 [Pseudomonadales bacterium]|nr:hypothetical protein [Pseudomonadales bacterium]